MNNEHKTRKIIAIIGGGASGALTAYHLGGPGRLGTLLESIAIPEIREQAIEITSAITLQIAPQVEFTLDSDMNAEVAA